MGFDAGKVRRGEVVAGGGALVLALDLFLLAWFAVGGPSATRPGATAISLDGWHSLTHARWILVITIVVSAALVVLTATRRSPALPVAFSIFTTVLGGLSSLLVLHRIVDQPSAAATAKPGLYLGLIGAVAIFYGGYLSTRAEASPFGDTGSIEKVRVGRTESDATGPVEPDAAPEPAARGGSDAASRAESSSAGPVESPS